MASSDFRERLEQKASAIVGILEDLQAMAAEATMSSDLVLFADTLYVKEGILPEIKLALKECEKEWDVMLRAQLAIRKARAAGQLPLQDRQAMWEQIAAERDGSARAVGLDPEGFRISANGA